ncbi:MAG: cysteine--tRNA ligase [Candidatus Micrarchaeota archaeon]
MALQVFNTLDGKKRPFRPRDKRRVGMYVCGITPYDASHLGHARCYVTWDMVKRYLKFRGYGVFHVQNITDVDDKIIRRASELRESPEALSARFARQYFEEFDRLNVQRADEYPKVTENIGEVVALIRRLEENGFAYESGGDVFYEVGKFRRYGILSGQDLGELIKGKRVEVNRNKRHPADFALWKAAKPGEPAWDSPWGRGRPGWHIECSAMSMKFLGQRFDLHCGGQDLVFPHHENEIAQSEAASGKKPFARYWMHNGFITVGKEKMAKSLGNFLTVAQALEKFEPDAIRFFMLSTHYRQPIDFSDAALRQASEAIRGLEDATGRLVQACGKEDGVGAADAETRALEKKFTAAMDDDFNTPAALAVLFEIRGLAFRSLETRGKGGGEGELKRACGALALLRRLLGVLGFKGGEEKDLPMDVGGIEALILERDAARKARDFARADAIRKELASKKIILEDRRDGTTGWRIA